MEVIDPGHIYRLATLDGDADVTLTFVKRDDPPEKYPGNTGHHPGTTNQEVLRVLLNRMTYVDLQQPCEENQAIMANLQVALYLMEARHARIHGLQISPDEKVVAADPACAICGHTVCAHEPQRP